jgi:hypothetical protein
MATKLTTWSNSHKNTNTFHCKGLQKMPKVLFFILFMQIYHLLQSKYVVEIGVFQIMHNIPTFVFMESIHWSVLGAFEL